MIDMAFDLGGGTIPAAYPFALWAEMVRHVPQLVEQEFTGVLPLRAAESNQGLLLPKRAKLVLRLPTTLADHVAAYLSWKRLDMTIDPMRSEGVSLQLGKGCPHPIRPHPTIHAQLVAGASDESVFTDSVNAQLKEMGIAGRLICGRHRTLTDGQQSIHGYSLVIHDLKPQASLQLQYAGLGIGRQFGCGIFVPHKVISGLGDG